MTADATRRLALAGFLSTAVAFGPARMGYGLFLPQLRESFGLSTQLSGFIASAAFAGFLLALLVTAVPIRHERPRPPLIAGGATAALGMALVAVAQDTLTMACGVVLAATSAGLCWAPYNNAAERVVPEDRQGRVLTLVSTGTTFGVAAAGLLAFAVVLYGLTWRVTWGAFAAAGLATALINAFVLRLAPDRPGPDADAQPAHLEDGGLRELARREALPLFAAALSFGATSAIYLSFAVDHVSAAGGLAGLSQQASGPLLFLAYGLVGAVGLLTAELEARIGLAWLLRGTFLSSALSLVLIALLPRSLPAVVVSAGLQGACVMTLSAVFAFWSLRLFPRLASTSFIAVLVVYSLGNAAGPALAGLLAETQGLAVTFAGTGALSLLTAAALPRHPKQRVGAPA